MSHKATVHKPDGGERDERGVRWWCVLPDVETTMSTARLLATEAKTVVRHASGRPWLLGHSITAGFRVITAGRTQVAMIGTCLASDRELHALVARAAQRGDYDALTALPGSYHLAVTGPDGAVVFGDVAGFRRVFITRVGEVVAAASHADVLRRLVCARVSRTWLAARLTGPEMPSVLRESLSPFEGIHSIPAGQRVTLREGVARTTPYWTPPHATLRLFDGARVVAEGLTKAVAARIHAASGPISVQLSGGLDSTAISCLAGRAAQNQSMLLLVTTASVSPGNDDLSWARSVAEHLTPAEHLVLDAQSFPRFFDNLLNAPTGMDEPASFTAAGARVRHVADLLAVRGPRVHLNGQGGDEVLLAPLAYLRDLLRAHPRWGWRHLRGQAALHDLNLPRLMRSALAAPSYPQWLRQAAQNLRIKASAEMVAVGWEAPPLLAPWASNDAEELARAAILGAIPHAVIEQGSHASLVRIRSAAYRAALYRDAMAGHGVPAEFPFLDRAVLEGCLAVRPWERTDPWQPKPLLRAALAEVVPERLLSRRTKAHYNDDIYRGWKANQHRVADLLDDSLLVELGLIDADVLRRNLHSFELSGLAPAFVTDTIACEIWLRNLTAPFTLHREAHDARTPCERGFDSDGVEYCGGRWAGAAR